MSASSERLARRVASRRARRSRDWAESAATTCRPNLRHTGAASVRHPGRRTPPARPSHLAGTGAYSHCAHEAHHPDPLPQRGGDRCPRRSPTSPARSPASTSVEWLVIDDGSTDRTVEVAREHGVDHIVRLTNNKGLAAGFQAGSTPCLKLGADVIVNTDADNQYYGGDIPKLVAPILAGHADMVVGDRQVDDDRALLAAEEAPAAPRLVGRAPGVGDRRAGHDLRLPRLQPRGRAPDAGRLEVHLHARDDHPGRQDAGRRSTTSPIRTNPKTRESRLFPSMWAYVRRNTVSIFRIYALYEPLRVFMTLARS